MNPLGQGPTSAQAQGTPYAPPAGPVGVTATPGNTSAVVSWTADSDATSYNVYSSIVSGTGYTLIAPGVTGTTYSDTGLANGVTYYYVVTGLNAGGEGPYSAEVNATPMSPSVIMSTATASGINGGSFSYQITAVDDPTSYSATGLPPGLSINATTGLISGTPTVSGTYTVTISAINVGGTYSATLTISVLSVAPAAPTGLTAARTSGGTVTLNWIGSNGATGYTVERSLTSGSGYTTDRRRGDGDNLHEHGPD